MMFVSLTDKEIKSEKKLSNYLMSHGLLSGFQARLNFSTVIVLLVSTLLPFCNHNLSVAVCSHVQVFIRIIEYPSGRIIKEFFPNVVLKINSVL